MAMENSGLSASDVLALTKDSDGLFGGGAGGILALIIVFILLFGGNGMWGNRGYEQYATSTEVQNGFNTQTINQKLNEIGNGICSLGYENSNLINGVNTTVMQTGNGIGQGITELGYKFQQCCCENLRNQDTNTRDILEAICSDGQATRALITENEITRLRTDLQSAQLALSNANQTQNILSSLGRFVTNPPCYANYTCGCNNGVTIA